MALIKCPECGGTVSDAASTCPHCGYPLKKEEKSAEPSQNVGMAIFKCAEKWAMQSAALKRTFEIVSTGGKVLATGKMGDMVSIPVTSVICVTVRLHGYFGAPSVMLKPNGTTYVNIAISQLGKITLQVIAPQDSVEKKTKKSTEPSGFAKIMEERGYTPSKPTQNVQSTSQTTQKPTGVICTCDLCKRELKNEMKYVVIIDDRKYNKKKMNICESCLMKEKKNGHLELLSSLKVK